MAKTFLARFFILLIFIPICLARALYEAVLGFGYGVSVEWNDFVRLMKNPVNKW